MIRMIILISWESSVQLVEFLLIEESFVLTLCSGKHVLKLCISRSQVSTTGKIYELQMLRSLLVIVTSFLHCTIFKFAKAHTTKGLVVICPSE